MDSILNTIKRPLGIPLLSTDFDDEVIMHINSVFMELYQLGVGPTDAVFSISSTAEEWDDFLDEDVDKLSAVKTFIHLKVKMLFDSPTNAAVIESFKEQIRELQFRLMVQAEPPLVEEVVDEEDVI